MTDISFDQLQAFVAAAERGSFSAAARHLRKAQSVVSTHVANLEVSLGVALFDRESRSPILTQAGVRLLHEARVVLERREHLVGVAYSIERNVEESLVIAVDELFPMQTLGQRMVDFSKAFPFVELKLLFPRMEDVSQLVLSAAADLGIMWRQESLQPELGFRNIGWVPLKLVCASNHPLAQGSIAWEELKRYRQIQVTPRGGGQEKSRLRVASSVWWVESYRAMLELVRLGLGWAVVPYHLLDELREDSGLIAPSLDFDVGDVPVPLELVWHKQRPCGPAAAWLREHLVSIAP
ncbi:LysR family transcriptional regulator [Comamonas humi]